MNKTLIICYGYDGKNSNNANAICLDMIIDKLSELIQIDIITTKDNKTSFSNEVYKNIHRVQIYSKKSGKINFKRWNKDVLFYISNSLKVEEYKSILIISFPFNLLQLGFKIKKLNPNIKFLAYELDPYSYNKVLRFNKMAFLYRYFQENKVFKHADKILLTHELYSQYAQNMFSRYIYKLYNIGIPILRINSTTKTNNKRCIVIYTGSFYKNIRDPEFMLNTLGKVAEICDFQLHLYGPNPAEISESCKSIFGKKLFIHGRVSKEEIDKAIVNSSILINIGNKVDNQLPSKVLEYIGTGKPIINFYTIENDTSNRYLGLYPNSLLVKDDNEDYEDKVNKIVNFINCNKNRYLTNEQIFHIFNYYTYDEVVKRIYKELEM